jgi:hypothetical protein
MWKGIRDIISTAVGVGVHMPRGYSNFHSPSLKKQLMKYTSIRGRVMLVRISPRKKSLNLTRPKGAIKFWYSEYISSYLNALY